MIEAEGVSVTFNFLQGISYALQKTAPPPALYGTRILYTCQGEWLPWV
jgi:hypothetical protein